MRIPLGDAALYLRLPDSRPVAEVEKDIRDELQFHLEMAAAEEMLQGVSADEALDRVRERFGDVDEIRRVCRRVKLGDRIMLQRIQAVLMVMLVVAVIFMGVRMVVAQRANASVFQDVANQLRQVQAGLGSGAVAAPARPMANVSGRVLDAKGEPIAEADVLVIVKTWRSGYHQEDHAAKTDAKGSFILEGIYPPGAKHAVHVTVLHDGHAFQSWYGLHKEGGEVDPLDFRLEGAREIELRFVDRSGNEVEGVVLRPFSRALQDGTRHLVYHQGSEPVWRESGSDGRALLACFGVSDEATISYRGPGGEWKSESRKVPPDGRIEIVVQD